METKKKKRSFLEILRSEPLVLVDFYTEWCGPCKMMKPILEELHAIMGDELKILKVDVDKNLSAAQMYQIQSVPTLILFKNGEVIWRQSGVAPVSLLKQVISKFKNV